MAAEPLTSLTYFAGSVAEDLSYVALADISALVHDASRGRYRVIGGHMITALVARWGLGAELYRETADTDLGLPEVVVRDLDIVRALKDRGYEQIAGDRFARPVDDIPLDAPGAATPHAVIDVLIPAHSSRPARTGISVTW